MNGHPFMYNEKGKIVEKGDKMYVTWDVVQALNLYHDVDICDSIVQ